MGRRRKRRKKLIIRRPTMPSAFRCPNCEAETLVVEINKKEVDQNTGYYKAIIKCGTCGLQAEMWVPPIFQPVDVYSKFLDGFLEGKIEYKILKSGEERRLSLEELAGEAEHGEEYVEGSSEETFT
ncbi:zinc-binding protein [Pyrolobus fumarii]|uniref:zinc-binding protein n=1 Tax=Pyrolobus fumarii TaxID=54252 RepID=UPI00064ED293|nr:zinc-binding protein [Pyrolobus fumarii]